MMIMMIMPWMTPSLKLKLIERKINKEYKEMWNKDGEKGRDEE